MTYELLAIGQDNVSGAAALTQRAAKALAAFAQTCLAETPQAFRDAVIQVGHQLVAAQPTMASMLHLANLVLFVAEGPDDLNGLRAHILAAVQGFAQLLRQRAKAVARHAADLMPNQTAVVTLSHSSAVREALLAAHRQGKQVHVVCSESRPANEGLGLARLLAEAGFDRWVEERCRPYYAERGRPGIPPGVYFRLLLIGGGALLLGKVFLWGRRPCVGVMLVISSLLFAAAHHAGPLGEPFESYSFLYRAVCGLLLGVVFLTRGLGVAAWTHAVYNALVLAQQAGA